MGEPEKHHSALVESATAARLYYLEGKSKSEIARQLSQSRFKIARILDEAVAKGYVTIDIDYPVGKIDTALSSRLKAHLGIEHCLVIPDASDTAALMKGLGDVTADLLGEITTDRDILGLAWTRAMEAMMPLVNELSVEAVVQLGGAYPGAGSEPTALDLVREIGKRTSGPAYTFYAPMIATDAAAAAAIRRQVDVEAAFQHFKELTIALVGIGAWHPDLSTVAHALFRESPESFEKAERMGIAGDICGGITFTADGQFIPSTISDRAVTIDSDSLRNTPRVVGVAFDPRKATAVRGTIVGGYVTGLVTHAALAQALLTLPPVRTAAARGTS